MTTAPMTTATHSPFAIPSLRGATIGSRLSSRRSARPHAPLRSGLQAIAGTVVGAVSGLARPSLTAAEWDAVMAKAVTGFGLLITLSALVAATTILTAADYTVVAETVLAGSDGLVTVYDGRY